MSETAWVHMLGGRIEYIDGDTYRTRCLASGPDVGEGDKPPLILLHGIGGHAETYIKNMMPLADSLDDREVYSLDFVGHGYSSRPTDIDYHITDYMDQVEDFMNAIGHSSAHIHGESLGGWVAGRMGLDRPGLVESVGLITTSGVYHIDTSGEVEESVKEESISGIEDLYERSMEMLDERITRERVRDRLQWLFVEEVDDELVDIRQRIYSQEENQEAMRIIYDTFVDDVQDENFYFTTAELRELTKPTLIIHTEHNPSAQKELAEYIHNVIPDSTYYLYKNSAHWPQYEEPDLYNEHTVEFVRSHGD
ncbi:MAG: alpha/beta hydrolase [Halobacteria archaeon]|nr:alpha/beta hydrolase [Halobacteria archaeon]